ncbi:sigma factor G inhibitor Gin [Lihuaxuella thermophila]
MMCNQQHKEGLKLLGKYICTSCERDLVECDAGELRYLHYIFRLRALFSESITN